MDSTLDTLTCVTPSKGLIIYLIGPFLQCSLFYPPLNPQRLVRFLRLFMLPINLYACYSIAFRYCWRPLEQANGSNLLLSTLAVHSAFRSIEWASSHEPYFTRPSAWPDPLATDLKKDEDESRTQATETPRFRFLDWFTWSILAFSSMRGSHFTWGLRQSQPWDQIPFLTVPDLLRRLVVVHMTFLPALAYSILDRDLGVGWWTPTYSLPATILSNLAFGVSISGSMETYYLILTLFARLLHALPLDSPTWTSYWAPQAFSPTLFHQPHLARSMAEFWGRGWHALFRRTFLVGGTLLVKPFAAIGILRGRWKRMAILLATFFCSGLYHDLAVWGIAYSPSHPNQFKLSISHFLHTPMSYFIVQPFAILIEPLFLPYLPPMLQTAWVWAFTLVSVTGFRQAFFGQGRMLTGPKPVDQWGLLEILVPGYVLSQL
ncbi:hypothetical protein CROQUDRAFT_663040 [Cronartium quercuum f. sp. fusiforme G11]|uniref:Wax synthase domain-containing protein n=1 Tax=Cronartium quercuum f. sp. fusiforme G11 TaxID=708437 RepID=A0A9P6T902_9BASI|nr:hypothetical protein CROQUDRAFT_663040 [Cronartium quercuum f. sp. fusiforme G11]